MNRPKLAIVATHPIQHFCPLYRALAASGELDLRVFFASDAGHKPYIDPGFGQMVHFQEDLLAGFSYEFLPGHLTGTGADVRMRNPHLGERLSAFDPDVVQAYGYYQPLSRDTVAWARRAGKKILICSDSELRAPRKLWTKVLKALLLPRFFAGCDGFLTIGDCNEAYYRHYGVDPARFFRSPYPIDDASLTKAVQARDNAKRVLAEKFHVPAGAAIALAVGKLTERKAVGHAIQAVSAAWASGFANKICLIVAGNGPEKERLEALAHSSQPEAIRFAGFVEVDDLPLYYSAADLLIHPSSQDPHPLATSEAVFCGLPVIVSDRVGSVGPTDDVRLGINGMQYKFGDVQALTGCIIDFLGHPERHGAMRHASLRIGRERALRVSVNGYLQAVQAALQPGRERRNPSRPDRQRVSVN